MAAAQPNETLQTYLLAAFQNSPVAVAVTGDGTFIDVVLLVSGYSADWSGAEMRQQPGRYFLQKPFSSARFVETVRACLDSR